MQVNNLVARIVSFVRGKTVIIPLLFIAVLALVTLNFSPKNTPSQNNLAQEKAALTQDVLGRNVQAPQIYVYGGEQGMTSGGIIAQASTDEPTVQVAGYNVRGSAAVSIYKTDENTLLNFLIHDKDGKQVKTTVDTSAMQFVGKVDKQIDTNNYNGSSIALPLEATGVWYLNVKFGSTTTHAFIVRSNVGVLAEEGDNEFIFWGQNFETRRSISEGSIRVLSLNGGVKEVSKSDFNSEGIARSPITDEADVAAVSYQGTFSIVPLNLKYLNNNYSYSYKNFRPKPNYSKYFIFTDRPIYKPGDEVSFKAIIRNDDDVRYTIPQGQATVKIYNGYYYEGSDLKPVFQKSIAISSDGTVNGTYKLPEDGSVGFYNVYVELPNQTTSVNGYDSERTTNYVSFSVEHYRKPEFSLEITTPKSELIASQDTTFQISGEYFSGQPLIGQKVKYTVYSADYFEYEYITDYKNLAYSLSDDYRYGAWYGSNRVMQGEAVLDHYGRATVKLPTRVYFNKGISQVFSIEAATGDGSLDAAFARKNILVYAGQFGIYREGNYNWSTKVGTPLVIPIALQPTIKEAKVAGVTLTARVKRENWVAYQEPNKKYPSYRQEVENLRDVKVVTDGEGKAKLSIGVTKVGYYTVEVEAKDGLGNVISKTFYSYVYSADEPFYTNSGDSELTISTNKKSYAPGEEAKFTIHSTIADRDVFFAFERARVQRFQIVHMNGKNADVNVKLLNTDIPNVYAKVASFSNFAFNSTSVDVPVSADSKKVNVKISPNAKKLGPGESLKIDISTTDIGGNPVAANVALWLVDKAIYELAENNLGDIFDYFWQKRYDTTAEAHSLEGILVPQAEQGGGCFAAGTKVLMADGSVKNIEDVKEGDYVATRSETDTSLVSGKVLNPHKVNVGGYLIINKNLRVTDNHIIRVNGTWKEAGNIQIGDKLTNKNGSEISVASIEWIKGKFEVYNFTVEKYHTYFAGGVWVHNDKAAARTTFKDTAYWNPEIQTDSQGKASVTVKLPDNLTTWAMAAVASTKDTKVGQTTNEVVVSKDVIVRPIVPNIIRMGDSLVISALVQNFTDAARKFDVDLRFDSGVVTESMIKDLSVGAGEMERVYWKVVPTKANEKAKFTFSARSQGVNGTDIIVSQVPVLPFGFVVNTSQAAQGDFDFPIKLNSKIDPSKSTVKLSLAASLVGSLPDAMQYLIQYPYGCVEQTTSRFVPAVIAKIGGPNFAALLKGKEIDEYIKKGLSRLSTLQRGDGGWSWWYADKSDYYITSYVLEYILLAKEAGAKVDEGLLARVNNYFEYTYGGEGLSNEQKLMRAYGMTLLKSKQEKPIFNMEYLTPDLLAIAVMTNYINGNKDPETNGLTRLISLAKTQGDSVYWDAGREENFGSIDASTALAIRAILMAGTERNLAEKAMLYLTNARDRAYWSNTFATAQVMRAIEEFSKTGSELTPNYSYNVNLDGKSVSTGNVKSATQLIDDIKITQGNIKDGSVLSVKKTGEGQLYSTLTTSQFVIDRNFKGIKNGMYIKRQYVNEKGEDYTIGVGDTVTVKLTIGGLKNGGKYLVIDDQLPSGMVPVNEKLLNEQYSSATTAVDYNVAEREVTQNGMILSIYQAPTYERVYTYTARVVSQGEFTAPPATVALMYQPEVYGMTGVANVTIVKESNIRFEKQVLNFVLKFIRLIIVLAFWIGIIVITVLIFREHSPHVTNPEKRTQLIGNIKSKFPKIFKKTDMTDLE